MIKRNQFLEKLHNLLDTEEEIAKHFYTYTTKSLKYYKWLDEDKKAKLGDIIAKLSSDCHRHKSMVEKLIQHVKEGDKNVF